MNRRHEESALDTEETDADQDKQHRDNIRADTSKGLPEQHTQTDAGFGSNPAQQSANQSEDRAANNRRKKGLHDGQLAGHTCSHIDAGQSNDLPHQSGHNAVITPAILGWYRGC